MNTSNNKSTKNNQVRNNIFQNAMYLTDGGTESTLIYHHGIELNHFAAFELLNNEKGRRELEKYFQPYLDLTMKYGYHFLAETPTWRANPDWGFRLGYSANELSAFNRSSVRFMRTIIDEHNLPSERVLISGNIGPRGDGYFVENVMTPGEAKAYHSEQINAFALADADLVSAFTINYTDEAIGIVLAARDFHIPVVISFTVETDGRLPDGETLKNAIEKTDAATEGYTTHFMINCAHPEHFMHLFEDSGEWINRIGAIRANASVKSHAELDNSETLDAGDKCLLANGYLNLKNRLPNLKVVGGCCGTDHTHIAKICGVLAENEPCMEKAG